MAATYEATFIVTTTYGTYKIVRRATMAEFPATTIRDWLAVGLVLHTIRTAIPPSQLKRITWTEPIETTHLPPETIVRTVSEERMEAD